MTLENRGSNFAWQVFDRLVDFGSAMTERDAYSRGTFRLIIQSNNNGKGGVRINLFKRKC